MESNQILNIFFFLLLIMLSYLIENATQTKSISNRTNAFYFAAEQSFWNEIL